MPRCARFTFLVVLALSIGSQAGWTQDKSCVGDKQHPCNGISVGKPKVFDNRTLTLMLESLSQSLQSMQSQFVNQQALSAALATIQGFQSHDVTSNFQVNTLPIPGVTQQVTKNAGALDANGNPIPPTTQTQTTTTQNSYAPQPPALETTPAFSGFNPSYGENSADLLSDQVNLSYQVFNLRMILERALSDRLLPGSEQKNDATRLQAVLGFNVTIDPPRTANDAVAVVEIRLTDTTHADGDLSLVALMPQEKTYNSASLTTKSNSFGGTAVVHMIQVGYSQRRRGQTFYLYRDNDTVSYERMDPTTNELIFGWMFRPVLGRRSVSPGMRQLFAIASLPAKDCTKKEDTAATCPAENLKAHVRTFWKKYDASTLTSFEPRDRNRAATFKNVATLTLTKPQIFEGRYENQADYEKVPVEASSRYQSSLGPTIDRISWVPVGAKSALISAIGNNFFSGTQVTLGDKTYSGAGDGLILKSNQAFDLYVPIDALASGTGAVIGRYGPATPLIAVDNAATTGGIVISEVDIGPSKLGVHRLDVKLTEDSKKSLQDAIKAFAAYSQKEDSDVRTTPVVTVNGNIVPLPYGLQETGKQIEISGYVPDSFLTGCSALVKVSYPFLPDRWTAYYSSIFDASCQFQLTRISDSRLLLTSRDPGFKPIDPRTQQPTSIPWTLYGGCDRIDFSEAACQPKTTAAKCTRLSDYGYVFDIGNSCSAPTKPADKAVSDQKAQEKKHNSAATATAAEKPAAPEASASKGLPDKIVLVSPIGAASSLDVPKATAADASMPKPFMLHQYDSTWIDVTGDDLSTVQSVEANKLSLQFKAPANLKPGEKVKSIKVEITRELTSKPGNIDVNVLDKANILDMKAKVLGTAHLQIICTDCKNGEGGK